MFQSTHSLRSATLAKHFTAVVNQFQSTHSLRSATSQHVSYLRIIQCFNPRTPCGVRRMRNTTLRAYQLFQSTHSLRSATASHAQIFPLPIVSIHALLAECDRETAQIVNVPCGFNPRTPCGVRLEIINGGTTRTTFQSTHSLRSATHLPYGQR